MRSERPGRGAGLLAAALCLLGLGGTTPAAADPPVAATQAPPPAAAKPSPAPAKPPPAPVAPAPAPVAKVAAGGILGRAVLGPDGQEIGRVVDVLVDAASNPRAAVIDFGGFLGVGNRQVAVDWSDLTFPPTGGNGDIKLDMSLEQISSAPAYTDQTKPAAVVESPAQKPPASSGH